MNAEKTGLRPFLKKEKPVNICVNLRPIEKGVFMKKKLFCMCESALISVLLVFMMSVSIYAEPVESIHIIKISSQDESAIVRTPDGRMQIIKVGDILRVAGSGSGLRVIEITSGRVVFEEKTERGIETVIVRVVDGKQRIERIRKAGEERPILYRAK
jgi:hypothetical protein